MTIKGLFYKSGEGLPFRFGKFEESESQNVCSSTYMAGSTPPFAEYLPTYKQAYIPRNSGYV